MVISADNPDLIFRSGTTGEPLPPQYGQAGLRFTQMHGLAHQVYTPSLLVYFMVLQSILRLARHVKGRLSLWLPVLITLVVVVLVSRVVVFITDVLSSKCVAGLTLSHYSACEGSPIGVQCSLVESGGFCSVVSSGRMLTGLTVLPDSYPWGLSLRTKRRKREFCP